MRLSFTLIATAVTLVSAATDVSPVRKLVRRKLEENDEYLNALAMLGAGDMSDYACLMSVATSEDDCHVAGPDCVWCPVGDLAGFCVSSEQKTMVNMMQIPHIQCGNPASEEDTRFWDELVGCEMAGGSSTDCLGNPGCAWCSMQGGKDMAEALEEEMFESMPSFGFCMSNDFKDEVVGLMGMEPGGEDIVELMKNFATCDQESTSNLDAPGIVDIKCAAKSITESFCSSGTDSAGNPCVWTNVIGMVDVCLSSSQNQFLDWYIDALAKTGIDLNAIANGDMSSFMDLMDEDQSDGNWDELWDGEPDSLGDEEGSWDLIISKKELPLDTEEIVDEKTAWLYPTEEAPANDVNGGAIDEDEEAVNVEAVDVIEYSNVAEQLLERGSN